MTQQKNRTQLLNALPDAVRSRVALLEDSLYISEEQRGILPVVNLTSAMRELGVTVSTFVPASQFDAQYAMYASRIGLGENDIQQIAIDMIARAHRAGATDIHIINLGSYVRVRFRVLGILRDDMELNEETGMRMIRAIYEHMGAAQDAPAFDAISRLDGRIVNRNYLPQGVYSVRIHVEPIECDGALDGKGTFMPLRLMYDTSEASGTLEERLTKLGYTDSPVVVVDAAGNERTARPQTELFRLLASRTGIVFISGPTGSGKSTALSHCMEALIEERPGDNFVSIEDPPEKPIKGLLQMPVNSKEGEDRGAAYTDAIAGTNRDDTDTVMVGEIRYAEAALATLEVALSGNSVWTTIHAPDALGIIQRLYVLLRNKIAEPLNVICDPIVLSGLVFQRLVPRLCPHCRIPLREHKANIDKGLLARLRRTMPEEAIFGGGKYKGIFLRGAGCDKCKPSGHAGLYRQTVVAEVIAVNPAILSLLRQKRPDEARRYWLHEMQGMTYLEHARHLILSGVLDPALTEDMLSMPIDADLDRLVAQSRNTGGRK